MMSFGSQLLELSIKTQPKQKGTCPSELRVTSGCLGSRETSSLPPPHPQHVLWNPQPEPVSGEARAVGDISRTVRLSSEVRFSAGWGCACISPSLWEVVSVSQEPFGVLSIQLSAGLGDHDTQSHPPCQQLRQAQTVLMFTACHPVHRLREHTKGPRGWLSQWSACCAIIRAAIQSPAPT